jgi:hypothetical protein
MLRHVVQFFIDHRRNLLQRKPIPSSQPLSSWVISDVKGPVMENA